VNGELEIGEETSMTIMIVIMMKWNMAMAVFMTLCVSHYLETWAMGFRRQIAAGLAKLAELAGLESEK